MGETEQLGIPETPYQCTVQMNADEFQRIVRDLQVLGDTCTISCGKEGIRFSVSGAIGNGNILIRSNDEENQKDRVTINMDEPVELNFALRYLNFFTKATPLSSTVIIPCLLMSLLLSSIRSKTLVTSSFIWHPRSKKTKSGVGLDN